MIAEFNANEGFVIEAEQANESSGFKEYTMSWEK